MSDESDSRFCPRRDSPVPLDAPGGLCPKCLMVQAAASTGGDGLPPEAKSPPSREAVSAAFPQLEILELIGQGGMGVVFKARQPKLNRFVALKILPERLAADPAFAERFAREGQMLARLNHPNIVTVHDFGESGGFYYLLMEFVDGVDLRRALRAGGFTPQQALGIVPKICEALQYAHDEGVLHRDIKPENILLDTKGRVKIADFGIAKFARDDAGERLTGSGAALGTPHYMAPEQIERPSDVDHRADIYSLGVVFYELLTGELPLGRFAPPSEKAAVDPRVDEVVLKALERERERRQQSAAEVRTQVQTIASHPYRGVPGAGPISPRHRGRLAALVVVLSLLLPTVGMLAAFVREQNARYEQARVQVQLAQVTANLARLRYLSQVVEQELDAVADDVNRKQIVKNLQMLQRQVDAKQAEATTLKSQVRSAQDTFAVMLVCGALLLAMLSMGISGTVMGWRHLSRVRGTPPPRPEVVAATFAALFWPLLGLDGLIALLVLGPAFVLHGSAQLFALVLSLELTLVACLVADIWLARRTWRWVGALPPRGTASQLPGSPSRAANPWPRRLFWLIVALVGVPALLFAGMVAVYLLSRAPPSQPSGPRASVIFDNVTAVEDLLIFDMSVIVDPPHPDLRLSYLGQPLEPSRVASVPKAASGRVIGPAAELREGFGQCTWQLAVDKAASASVLSSHVVLVLPDADAARKAAEQVRWLATDGDQHFAPDAKLKLFTLDPTPQGPYAAWLQFPSDRQGTAVVVNWQPDLDALRAKQPKVVGNVAIPYRHVAEFDVLLRNGYVERLLPQLSFFAVHDDPQRRQELVSLPVAWSLSPNKRARSPTIGRLQVGDGLPESINVSQELPDTELVAWRMSPGYLTDDALMEGLRHLPVDRWLDSIAPLAPGETRTSRLFYGEPKLPTEHAPDGAHRPERAIVLRISVHTLPAGWTGQRPGIHVKAAAEWRHDLGLSPKRPGSPGAKGDGVGSSVKKG